MRRPPCSTLFPYTTLFRFARDGRRRRVGQAGSEVERHRARRSAVAHPQLAARARRETGEEPPGACGRDRAEHRDRKSTRLNSSHVEDSYAVLCLKKKKKKI